jgi:hypothetical protein
VLLGDGQDVVLALGVLFCGARLFRDDLEAPLNRGEVREHKVERELLQLGRWIRLGAETTGDLDEDVGLARKGDALGAASGRCVLDPDLGRGDLERLHGRSQAIQTFVGHIDHADAVCPASGRQRIEQRGLARPGRANDCNVYRQLDFQS